ncbi:BLUF domain-containing protein [Polaribacter vadi]|uniref:BLUF domain-containing protein n=1 Tax=Polaribacter TaxID=52959 RepID=UPI001C0A01E7|nr:MULTISPECIES: BLUF domain-containing protein [Polaribacter]MBU3012201.1 BLUF domain-containing protein [Polaribacter vadi]MDO6742017.1 BLUF domain-containing protein [Polaribacter sp. 1_MG-2023]
MLKQLVYYSIANQIISDKIIGDILETSRKHNSSKEITGCLLYYDNVFLQLLEGKKEDIDALYKSIKKDQRHFNVTLIAEEFVNERMYPDWSMAYHKFRANQLAKEKFRESVVFLYNSIPKKLEAIDFFCYMTKEIINK